MPKDEQPKKKPTKEVIQQVCDWMFEDIVAAGTQYGRNIVNSVRAKFGPELLKPNGRSLHPRLLRAFRNLGEGDIEIEWDRDAWVANGPRKVDKKNDKG